MAKTIFTGEYERLHIAIAALPPEQQLLIHKVYFQEESVASIAKLEGVTDMAIWNRLKRIFKKLKKYLN